MIVSVSIFLVGSVKIKLMRYFESSEITRCNMLNQQGITQQNIAIFILWRDTVSLKRARNSAPCSVISIER
ncbi:hypothetical protein B0915_19730 [Escherichia coli]|nr:hypothetical protein B0915_19730 [Escherichia coli]